MAAHLSKSIGAAMVALAGSGVQAADIYLPRTRVHIQCRFADGSYTEYKVREKWAFSERPGPHRC